MRTSPSRLLLSGALTLLIVACGSAAEPAPGADDLCERAREHLNACSGQVDLPLGAACDIEVAQTLLQADCDAVSQAVAFPKADGAGPLAAAACALGFFAACETPACETAPLDASPPADVTAEASACVHLLDATDCALCSYYDCRESISQCGEDGYLTGYVGRYCQRFAQVTEPRVSPAAAAWLGRVRRCLVDYLEAEVPYDADCETTDRLGTDSHAQCYVETGFCDLSPLDWFHIVHSIDVGDVPLRVVLRTAHGCLRSWL